MKRKPSYEELERRVRYLEGVCPRGLRDERNGFPEENWYQVLLDTLEDGVDVVGRDFVVVYANDNLRNMVSNPDLDGHLCYEAFLGRTSPCKNCPMQRSLESGRTEAEELHLDNGMVIEVRASALRLPSGGKGAVEIVRDITLRKKAEEDLRREKRKLQTLVDEAPFGFALIAEDGRYRYINPKFIEIFGYTLEDVPTGREWFRKAYPESDHRRRVISQWFSDHGGEGRGEAHPRIQNVTCKDGAVKVINFRSVTMETGEALVICEDITENRRMEAMLQRAQRLEAMGTLAGGIAHDFNNILMGIQGNASLLLLGLGTSSPSYERLKNIEQHVQSGADLTRQLLGFAKGGKYETVPTDINETVRKTAQMFGRTRKEVTIHETYQEDIWTVEVDRGQMEQVFLNLFLNAWQAMPAGGDLYLETGNILLDKRYVAPHQVEPGRYVKISVTDTGVGMDEATRNRIFEPFFTTRGMGRGTGLGLASVYGIIRNHHGVINVYSEKGQGTTFNVYLPGSDWEKLESVDVGTTILRGTERILLIDDEEMILDVGENLLKSLGYRIITAGNGREALKIYGEKKDVIDLVVLDMIMPDMGGGAVYDGLKAINPEVRVLLSSGYSMNGQAVDILKRGCSGFIQKPFNIQQLSHELRKILDKGPLG